MSVKTIIPKLNLSTTENTDDAYSAAIWADCPYQAIVEGELPGEVFEFDFDTLPAVPPTTEGAFGLFSVFTSTGGTILTPATGYRGWDIGSDGDNEGVGIRSHTTPFQISRTNKKLWFEVAIKTSTIADTKHNILVGLIEDVAFTATVPITALGAISDNNMVGFRRTEAALGGALMDTVYKANGVTAVTVKAGAVTLVADTYVKLGMVFEPNADPQIQDTALTSVGKYNLTFYKNGVRLPDYKQIPSAAGTDFPNDVALTPFFAVLNATASSPGTSAIRRMRVAQLY